MPLAFQHTLEIYLKQWLKVASGDRVTLTGGVQHSSGTNSGYLVLKCTCGSNWHVGLDNFYPTVVDPAVVTVLPSGLSNWVKNHRHVCDKYKGLEQGLLCSQCNWPYGAHEESWLAKSDAGEQLEALQKKKIEDENKLKKIQEEMNEAIKAKLYHGIPFQSGGQEVTYYYFSPLNFPPAPSPPKPEPDLKAKQFKGRVFREEAED